MANTYISRTQANGTSAKKFTASIWFKRSPVTNVGNQPIWSSSSSTGDALDLILQGNGEIVFEDVNGNAPKFVTSRQLRDPSAFYNVVVAVDSTQATDTNRVKIYLNGVQETSFSTATYPTQNMDFAISTSADTMKFGSGGQGPSNYFNGVMSHVHFIDGTQYAASEFGETDSTTGEWKIKTSPSVTYGTNGFFILKDGNSVTDQSGNSNNFTVGGGTLTKTEDCPDNNFATLNPVYKNFNQPTFTLGNNTTSSASGGYFNAFSSIAVSTGKYYAEIKRGSSESQIGISSLNDAQTLFPQADYYIGETSKSLGISNADGKYRIGTTGTTYGSSYTTGDIIGLALDLTNKKLYASKNGAWSNGSGAWSSSTFDAAVGAIDISAVIPSGEYSYIGFSIGAAGTGFNANFGNGYFGTTAVSSAGTNASGIGIFEYDVPANFTALSTKGLNL